MAGGLVAGVTSNQLQFAVDWTDTLASLVNGGMCSAIAGHRGGAGTSAQ